MVKEILLLSIASYLIQGEICGQWAGTVVSESGSPLRGVRVCSLSWSCSVTREDGSFSHSPDPMSGTVLNFSLAGFVPRSVAVGPREDDMKVTLKAGSGTWTIRPCQPRTSYQFFGGRLGVKVPRRTTLVRFRDVDYDGASIRYSKKEALRIGGGPTWSRGLPDAHNLSNSKEVIERTLLYPGRKEDPQYVFLEGVDVRGIYPDGRRWRFTGDAFQTFVYDSVSPEAAQFFDAILDTLCEYRK